METEAPDAGKAHRSNGVELSQLESNQEALAKVSIKDLAIAGGISTEKALLLAGNPTKITETRSEAQRYESAIKNVG